MTVETTLRLAQIPNIAGVKDATGNLGQTAATIAGAPPRKASASGAATTVTPCPS